jgi:1,4-dihydroxy-6-naphthoate synthase
VKPLRLAFSSCPNDTFVFHAWVHGLIPGAPVVEAQLFDIDHLNQMALANEADVIKVSIHAFAHLRETYALLHSGGALGRGVGPLVVARKDSRLHAAPSAARVAELADNLGRARIAIPGELTTAALLVGLLTGGLRNTVVMPFDRIMPAVVAGEVDAGAIIHEGRFTFGSYGLRRLVDLGEWWEVSTGLPLPLGGIAVSRSLPREVQAAVEHAVHAGVSLARLNPDDSRGYVAANAQEMDAEVCQAHIDLYVNDFTLDYGPEGVDAIQQLLVSAAVAGVAPYSQRAIFWDEEPV